MRRVQAVLAPDVRKHQQGSHMLTIYAPKHHLNITDWEYAYVSDVLYRNSSVILDYTVRVKLMMCEIKFATIAYHFIWKKENQTHT